MKSSIIYEHEELVFWKWVSQTTIAIVTQTAVHHWSIDDDRPPQKVYDRHPSLLGCSIVYYLM